MKVLSWFLSFGLFIIMATLFFMAGFLMCYTLFPPRPANITNLASSTKALATPYDEPTANEAVDRSYAQRRKMMSVPYPAASGISSTLLDRAQEKSLHETRIMTQGTINQFLDEWSLRIREKLGPIFGAAVVPFTSGLAKNVVDNNFAEKRPPTPSSFTSTSSKAPQATTSTQSVSPQAATSITTGRYTLQLQDFKLNTDAHALAQDLQQQNFSAYVVQSLQNSHLIYSVRVGSFDRLQDAQDAARLLQTMGIPSARVLLVDRTAAQPQPSSSQPQSMSVSETHP